MVYTFVSFSTESAFALRLRFANFNAFYQINFDSISRFWFPKTSVCSMNWPYIFSSQLFVLSFSILFLKSPLVFVTLGLFLTTSNTQFSQCVTDFQTHHHDTNNVFCISRAVSFLGQSSLYVNVRCKLQATYWFCH